MVIGDFLKHVKHRLMHISLSLESLIFCLSEIQKKLKCGKQELCFMPLVWSGKRSKRYAFFSDVHKVKSILSHICEIHWIHCKEIHVWP